MEWNQGDEMLLEILWITASLSMPFQSIEFYLLNRKWNETAIQRIQQAIRMFILKF